MSLITILWHIDSSWKLTSLVSFTIFTHFLRHNQKPTAVYRLVQGQINLLTGARDCVQQLIIGIMGLCSGMCTTHVTFSARGQATLSGQTRASARIFVTVNANNFHFHNFVWSKSLMSFKGKDAHWRRAVQCAGCGHRFSVVKEFGWVTRHLLLQALYCLSGSGM